MALDLKSAFYTAEIIFLFKKLKVCLSRLRRSIFELLPENSHWEIRC